MTFSIRETDVADDRLRAAIAGPLIAYNQAKTGRNDYRPLILAIDDEQGRVIGGLWGRTVYDWLSNCCSCRMRCAAGESARS